MALITSDRGEIRSPKHQMAPITSVLCALQRLGTLCSRRCGPAQHGLSPDTMARITSDCDAMRSPAHQMARITSGCAPLQGTLGREMFFIVQGTCEVWKKDTR